MKRIQTRLFLAVVTLGLITPGLTISSHAATWHQGTPKGLRGNWTRKAHAGLGKNRFAYTEGTRITKTHFSGYGLGDPFSLNHLKYRKLGHHSYALKGKEYIYSHKTNQIKVVRSGQRLKWRITHPKAFQNSYSSWFLKK